MAYSGAAVQAVYSALLSAYPSRKLLEQFATDQLNVQLAELTSGRNLRDDAFDLAQWANNEERLKELIEKASQDVPQNDRLREALKYVEDPPLVEDRWFARFVPLITWLLGVLNILLLLVAIRIYLLDPIDLSRPFWSVMVVGFVAYLIRTLHKRLTGGPVRTDAALMLLRRLITHSRLVNRDWVAFAMSLIAASALTGAVIAASPPVSVGFDSTTLSANEQEWDQRPFPDEAGWLRVPQCATQSHEFECGYYRVDVCVRPLNPFDKIILEIDIPTAGVAFRDVRLSKPFISTETSHQRLGEGILSYSVPAHDLRQLLDCHKIPFTLQRRRDPFPPREVTIEASIRRNNEARTIITHERETFPLP